MVESDLDAVERIARASASSAAIWTRSQLIEMLANPSLYEAWVAEEARAVVGFLYFHLAGDEAELDNLAVDPDWRRRGIASGLLATICQRAAKRGATAMFLELRRSNGAALDFYEQAGFSKLGTRANYYTDPIEDAIRLVRKRL